MGQNLAMFGNAGQQPGQVPGGPTPLQLKAHEQERMGRFGDSIIAHLTPGELTIPVQLQSPAVLKAVKEEFARVKVDPSKFVAGSPNGSRNPATGNQEFSLWAPLLGALGGIVGTAIAPGIGTVAGSALGSAAGEAASGGNLNQDLTAGLESGAMSGVGGGLGSSLAGAVGSGAAGSGAAGAAGAGGGTVLPVVPSAAAGNSVSGMEAAGGQIGSAGAGGVGSAGGAGSGLFGHLTTGLGAGRVLGGAIGGAMGAASAGPTGKQPSNVPPGFNTPMGPINPNFNQAMGNQNASHVGFNGFNPTQSAQTTGQGFNFYSPQAQGS